ncbi:MAG: hypothetical protein ACM3PE_01215 [Deltaproteobacteria bacterium]
MKRSIITTLAGITLIVAVAGGLWIYRVFAAIPDMFIRNAQLQAEGYYTGEFEFKMLACAYYLDQGQYIAAFSRLAELQEQQKTRQGLIKVPAFKDKKAEMNFYLGLQNPHTGAFMDETYPAVFYYEPTENVINHLEELAKATGQPLHLRYPLRFMEKFDTPEELTACLDDLSRVGWIGAKLPKTNFVLTTQFISGSEYEDLGGYSLAPGYKNALLKWFSANQDPATGTWGPRDRKTGRQIYPDLNCTYRVIKLFIDEQGHERYAAFPLQHRRELFATILQQLSQPMPDDLSSAEVHDWNLSRTQAVKMMTLDLWEGASSGDRARARAIMTELVRNRYAKFYREQEGAFVYYPDTEHATLDGTGSAVYLLKNVGALSDQTRDTLWGAPLQTMKDLGQRSVSAISSHDLQTVTAAGVNSIRIYASRPEDDFTDGIHAIVYPQATPVLDVADLMPRVSKWVKNTPQSMGNWTSREKILQDLNQRKWPVVPDYQGSQGLALANELLRKNGQAVLVGFDVLQVPRTVITFKMVR